MRTEAIGDKIKEYRLNAGISQLELELQIEAAPGSISRIESNKVNPTKETLSKIAKALKLNSSEIASLVGVEIYTTDQLIKAITTLSRSLDLDTVLQTAVDIMYDLYPNYNGGVLLLINQEGDKVCGKTVSNMPNISRVHKLLPKKVNEYYFHITAKENIVVKSILNDQPFQSYILSDFTHTGIQDRVVKVIGKILGFQSGVTIPIKYESKIIGASIYTKRIKERFNNEEIKVLTLLNDQIGIVIKNAEKYKELEYKLKDE